MEDKETELAEQIKEKKMATETVKDVKDEAASKDVAEKSKTEAQAEPAKREWTNLVIKGAFASGPHQSEHGDFYELRMPQGTKLGGAIDISGYTCNVSASRVRPYDYDPNAISVGFIKDNPITLSKDIFNEDTQAWEPQTMKAMPENLKTSLNKQYSEFKAAKREEREKAQQKDEATPAKDQEVAKRSAEARSKSESAPAQTLKK